MNGSNFFSGAASLTTAGTNNLYTVPVVATDSHGNSKTSHYQTTVPAEPTYSPTYDADGNELTNGAGQSYTWDAKNELVTVTYASGASSVYSYDALGRRIGIVEKNSSGGTTKTLEYVWNGSKLSEERSFSNTNNKKFFALGEWISSTDYYYTKDHLGSIREMTNSSGAIQARYDYDPYGRATPIGTISVPSDFQYAGYFEHVTSGLNLTLFRAYDPIPGRWLARDPLMNAEIREGPNLYEYVKNNPVDLTDPLGLCPKGPGAKPCPPGTHFGLYFNGTTTYSALNDMTGGGLGNGGSFFIAGSGAAMGAASWVAPPTLAFTSAFTAWAPVAIVGYSALLGVQEGCVPN